jgi:hypothetical protein
VLIAMLAVLGVVEGFNFAALNDLLLRASPPGHEAFGCALLSAMAAGWESHRLFEDLFGRSVSARTTLATVAAVAALLALRLVPASLVARREGEAAAP